jgi:hypothetical protein
MLMFFMLEKRAEIARAQDLLELTLEQQSDGEVVRDIGYPGGRRPGETIKTFGNYWYWPGALKAGSTTTPRRLNWFGLYSDNDGVSITVEVNVVKKGRNDRVGGFFGRDSDTGRTYLFHSARIGGGRAGVGKEAFLAWSNEPLRQVMDSEGSYREGVLMGPVEGKGAARTLLRYVATVAAFKEAVREGVVESPEFQGRLKQLRDYYAEPRGLRTGQRGVVLDYVSRHGDVVDALSAWLQEAGLKQGRRLVKNVLIDLGVAKGDQLEGVFEVKTSTDRSSIYAGIGQLMVHGVRADRRVLALPAGCPLPSGLEDALDELDIELMRFRLTPVGVVFPAS